MNKLLNSAMMPAEGTYRLKRVSSKAFASILCSEPFESYIGYPDTAQTIEGMAGVKIPLSRQQTTIEDGDTLLICKLKYRLTNPADKGKFTPSIDDFEFFICNYSEESL